MKSFLKKFIGVITSFCLLISITACGSQKPDEAVKGFFDALNKNDLKTAATFLNSNTKKLSYDNENQKKIVEKLFPKVKYKIISSTVSGNTAKVKANITAPDLVKITSKMATDLLPTIFTAAMGGNVDEKKETKMIEDYYIKSLSAKNVTMTSNEVNIQLVKDSNKKTWLIKSSDDLVNAISGNLSKAVDTLSQKTSSSSQKEKTDPKLYQIGQQATYERASITVEKVIKSDGNDFEKPKDGMEYVIVSIKEKNSGTDKNISYGSDCFKMQNSKGQITDSTFVSIDQNTELKSGELVPGGEVSGSLVFEEPKNDTGLVFMFADDNTALLKFQIK